MTTNSVRALIREVLAEELARIGKDRAQRATSSKRPSKSLVNEETVSINSDQDLQSLVQHVLKIGQNKSMRDKIIKGEYVFRLESGGGNKLTAQSTNTEIHPTPQQGNVVEIPEGFLSERKVETLPRGTRVVKIGPKVRFTPLARDRLRQRKIAVERTR